jgi:hypothetical protein
LNGSSTLCPPAFEKVPGETMVHRPVSANAFEFVILSSLRAAQLMRGCVPLVVASEKAVVTAQREIAEGKITAMSPLAR